MIEGLGTGFFELGGYKIELFLTVGKSNQGHGCVLAFSCWKLSLLPVRVGNCTHRRALPLPVAVVTSDTS